MFASTLEELLPPDLTDPWAGELVPGYPIEEMGAKLRAMMPWIKQRALVDRSRN